MQPQQYAPHPALQVRIPTARRRHGLARRAACFLAAAMMTLALLPAPKSMATSTSLKLGMTGTAVKTLQTHLVKRGYLSSADGVFGQATQAAVKLFQKHAGLTSDGIAGSATQNVLYKLTGTGKTNLTMSSGTRNSQVTILQKRLAALGYLKITTYTDYYGTATKAAVVDFQKKVGLTADGIAAPKTLIKLYSSNAPSSGTSSGGGSSGTVTLKQGMSGAAVKTLQTHLVKRGYLRSADGQFGSGTKAAVKLFQQHAGLSADGIAGATTQNVLYKLVGDGKTNQTLKSGQSSSQVTVLQKRLAALGYLNVTTYTTSFSAAVKAAVVKFQKKVGLTADGVAGPRTLVKLYSPTAPKYMTQGQKVVEYARTFIGKPYEYGAEGPNSFDCSGLVWYVYQHFGITVPRSSSGMINAGTAVAGGLANAKPGDILCFGDTLSTVGHVAIYVGNNQYIHAPQTGEFVRIDTLNQHRIDTCQAVRRIFTSD